MKILINITYFLLGMTVSLILWTIIHREEYRRLKGEHYGNDIKKSTR